LYAYYIIPKLFSYYIILKLCAYIMLKLCAYYIHTLCAYYIILKALKIILRMKVESRIFSFINFENSSPILTHVHMKLTQF